MSRMSALYADLIDEIVNGKLTLEEIAIKYAVDLSTVEAVASEDETVYGKSLP